MVRVGEKKIFQKGGSTKGKYLFAKKRGGAEYRAGPPPDTRRKPESYYRKLMMAPYPGMMKRYERYDAYVGQRGQTINPPQTSIGTDSGPPALLSSSPVSSVSSVERSPTTPLLQNALSFTEPSSLPQPPYSVPSVLQRVPGGWYLSPTSPFQPTPGVWNPEAKPMMTEINPDTILQNAILTQGMQARHGRTFFSTFTQTKPSAESVSTQAGPSTENISTQAVDPQINELKKELENYHKILTETGADVEKVVSLNESLADLLRESQTESSNREKVLKKTLNYLETFIDQVVGDSRWRQLVNKDVSADQQVQQILGLVSTRDPNLREFIKKVGLFAEKIIQVQDKNLQTEAEGVMGRPKRKTLASKTTALDVQPRIKRVKTAKKNYPFKFNPPSTQPPPKSSSPISNRTRSKKKEKPPAISTTEPKNTSPTTVSPVANRTRSKKKEKK